MRPPRLPRFVIVAAAIALAGTAGCGSQDTGGEVSVSAPSTTVATTTTTRSGSTPTPTPVVPEPITLGATGLGVVSFGDPEAAVMATLTEILGDEYDDQVHQAPFEDGLDSLPPPPVACWSAFGTTCFEYLRIVRWQGVGLTIVISDWTPAPSATATTPDNPIVEASPNLRGYSYWGPVSGPELATTEGITLGSSLDDLVAAYGAQLEIVHDECTFTLAGFALRAHDITGLRGELSALPESGKAKVTAIEAGQVFSNC